MMRTTLDGQAVAVSGDSLAAGLAAGAQAAHERGRVIIDVLIDGQPATPEALTNPSAAPGTCAELSLTSADPRSLAHASLLDAARALDTVLAEQQAAGQLLQAGQYQDANAHLGAALQLWQMVQAVLQQASAITGVDLSGIPCGPVAAIASLGERLGALKTAMQAQDIAAMSDLLLYDLCEQAKEWQALLPRIAEHVNAGAGR